MEIANIPYCLAIRKSERIKEPQIGSDCSGLDKNKLPAW